MNYEALQMLIKSIVLNFKCNFCTNGVQEKDINLLSIEGQRLITLGIICPNCKKTTLIKSEVVSVDFSKVPLTKEQVSMMKSSINTNNKEKIKEIKSSINDNLIVDLDKNLKKDNINVTDLFG